MGLGLVDMVNWSSGQDIRGWVLGGGHSLSYLCWGFDFGFCLEFDDFISLGDGIRAALYTHYPKK